MSIGRSFCMGRQIYELAEVLNVARWEEVQDWLAKITGTAIITVDYKGTPITKHSLCTDFCKIIRANPVSRKRCHKCDALAGLEAVRLNRPYIYLCHCGIVDVACPVNVDEKYLGAVMFGQVRIPDGDPDGKVERLVSEISSFHPESEQARQDLLELYEQIPEMNFERIEDIAGMINAIVQYTVNRYVNNQVKTYTYEWMIHNMEAVATEQKTSRRKDSTIKELPPSFAPSSTSDPVLPVAKDSTIYPALLYLENHLKDRTSMQAMAEICNLSSSYFSRLFTREVGENFRDYQNRRKIQVAKEMLRNTKLSIYEIAEELNFSDSSYFVRTFRKFEGITPSVYRRHKYR